MPNVQFKSVGDFILKPRCSKYVVGLQMRRKKIGCTRDPVDSGRKGRERQELRYELSVRACACGSNLAVLWLCTGELGRSNESGITLINLDQLSLLRERIPFL